MADPGFLQVLADMQTVHQQKSADYGTKDDPLANYTASERSGIPGWHSSWARVVEKVTRLESFVRTGTLTNEQADESLLDLTSTAAITLALYRRMHPCASQPSSSSPDS